MCGELSNHYIDFLEHFLIMSRWDHSYQTKRTPNVAVSLIACLVSFHFTCIIMSKRHTFSANLQHRTNLKLTEPLQRLHSFLLSGHRGTKKATKSARCLSSIADLSVCCVLVWDCCPLRTDTFSVFIHMSTVSVSNGRKMFIKMIIICIYIYCYSISILYVSVWMCLCVFFSVSVRKVYAYIIVCVDCSCVVVASNASVYICVYIYICRFNMSDFI